MLPGIGFSEILVLGLAALIFIGPKDLPRALYKVGQVVGKDEIGNGLFGFDDEAGPNAIELYVGRLRKKLAGAPLRITTVRGVGYLLETSDDSADADG